jgi:class 3 adenylate cyclase
VHADGAIAGSGQTNVPSADPELPGRAQNGAVATPPPDPGPAQEDDDDAGLASAALVRPAPAQAGSALASAGVHVDEPEAYIPRDRRRALGEGRALPDRVRGAALFADISGFTPLTEALANELGAQRGAEELTASIGRVFHAVIEELDRRGGDVIYFSGDAITCWLDGDDGTRAAAAAVAMREAIERVGLVRTPGGNTVQLSMKVALAVGPARRFVVGDPDVQLIDVLAGRLIDDLAEAEHHAEKGDVVLDQSAMGALGGRVAVSEMRAGGRVGVLDRLLVDVDAHDVVEPPPLPEELVRPWLLSAVYERLRTGRGEFLAELRPAYPVFIRFGGIDYDDDDSAIEKLDGFVRQAQRIFAGYGGNVLQLTLGDKGAYLYGVFGSPIAHEDDAARAAAAALELRDLDRTTSARELQIGITHGRLRSGTYGHAMRRTFVCLGDAVNLSARLMSNAPVGGIYVSDAVRKAAGDSFLWQALPELRVKGKAGPVAAHALTGSLERASRRRLRFELPLAGRVTELGLLEDRLARAIGGAGRVVGIAAEAGMGKSRLVAEFVRAARRRGLRVVFGECQSFGTTSPYFVWQEIWRRLLEFDDAVAASRQVAALRARLRAIDPALEQRAPLLGPVVGLDIADTELTASFDAKLRKTSLEDLLVRCLRSLARESPLVVVLEDCHWIDELSRDLLEALVRTGMDLPVLFVLNYRPAGAPGGDLRLERLPCFDEIVLAELTTGETAQVVRAKVEQLLGADAEAPDALVELVAARAEGNPLYVEELVDYLTAHGVDLGDAASAASVELPESLHSLVLSRIDTVAEEPRRTLKVASVVGRVFQAPVLPEVYPELGTLDDVRDHLGTLRGVDLVRLDREADEAYLFRHVVTQEVAYESMPFAVRASLHRLVGSYLERTAGDGMDHQLDLLAHHYWHSDDEPKKVEYLGRAADAARAAYANSAAIDYLERLVPLLEGSARVEAGLKLGAVRELAGDWHGAEQVEAEALALAVELGDRRAEGWCHTALAEVSRKQGRFDEAAEQLDLAERSFGEVGAEDGIGRVLHLAGTLAAQRGDYAAAQERYEASLGIREQLGDRASMGGLLSNLGVVAEYRGDYDAARALNQRALDLRTELGDRWSIGVSQNNLGMIALHQRRFEEACERFGEAMRLNVEVGDPWMVAIAHNNLGNANRGLGDLDAARADYAASLRAYRAYDDRWALGFLLEDVAVLLGRAGSSETAFELLGAAEALRAETGTPRGPSLEAELAEELRDARAAIGDEAAAQAVERGRRMGLDAALDLALDVTEAAAV